MDRTRDLLTTLLENLASRVEVEQYLQDFASLDAATFAVIKVGGGVLRDQLDDLASALAVLVRLGLIPVVVHGAGPQIDAALAEAGVASGDVDGLRVTTPEVLQVVRRTLQQVNATLTHALELRGARARPIVSGVFEATLRDESALGLVGAVESVHLEPITAALRSGCLPVVACLGESADGRILNINGDVAACELAVALRPGKIIFLTPTGGLLDEHGRLVPAIELAALDDDVERPWITGGMALKLEQIGALLDRLSPRSTVSITAPGHLARELFTHRGCGTLVRRGEPIDVFAGWDDVDTGRLRTTLESSFGRSLAPDYFDVVRPLRLLVARSYTAAAIVSDGPSSVPYLDKFAVTARAQGLGLGASLWGRLRATTPRFFWRSRRDNAINTWYFRQADGLQRCGDWVVFWCGLEDRDRIARCIEHAASAPVSWRSAPAEHTETPDAAAEVQHAAIG